jgi:hypothetical protein
MPKSARRLALLAGFTAALLLTSSMTPMSRAVAQYSNPHAAEYNAYAGSKYGYCDAYVLARLWQFNDEVDAKVNIGRKLLANEGSLIDEALKDARKRWPTCPTGFNFEDAPRVAALWTLPA